MKYFTIVIQILLFVFTNAYSTILNVPGSFSTIQSAINSANTGDTVLVEPGTYYENINFRGKKIVVTSRFYISNDLTFIQTTIINGSTPVNPDSASVVIIGTGSDSTTVLQGFKITGGTGTKWIDEHGAGIFREGGGILIAYSNPIIRFNIIANNEAMNANTINGAGGGGIRAGDCKPKILNNIIMNNTGKYGAGIVLNYTGAILRNNIIYGNSQSSTYSGGSGIWANNRLNTSAINLIENNTIASNTALTGTAGVLSYYSANLILKNNIIWGNISAGGAQIMTYGGGVVTATYNNIQNGYSGTGNINVSPQFSDSNFILTNTSPCIDAGDSAVVYNDPVDPGNPSNAKFPSKGTLRNDMGAYGGQLSAVISSISVIGIKNIKEELPNGYNLYQNYPNPFNSMTKIKWQMLNAGVAEITVFDILGRKILTLLNDFLQAGSYYINFDASSLTSGIYFYKFTTGEFQQTKSMTLIK